MHLIKKLVKIIHLSAECYPIAKVGGLADVVGALPKYQLSTEIEPKVIMPFYDTTFTKEQHFETVHKYTIQLGIDTHDVEILTLAKNNLGFDCYFVKIPDLLSVNYVYSSEDTERFIAFQIAVLDWMLTWEEKETIVHCHDHHTGLIPFMMTQCFKYDSLKSTPTVLTIHNAQYQGWFSYDKLHLIPSFKKEHIGLLDWDNCINPLAAAIKCAWRVTTVSPSYMEELKTEANGLEHLLRQESAKCIGILNGVDTEVWNPETDPFIIKNYKKNTVVSGRQKNKKWLCKEFNLNVNKPLFAFIGRLVGEKGADLLPGIFEHALNNQEISVLLLGSGEEGIETKLLGLKNKFDGTYNAYIGYDEKLSHIIYAGADFLLMPSRVEPCGLNQMYALRYGLLPIVRSIGGLKDTIVDIKDGGFGFTHTDVTIAQVTQTISRAVALYDDKKTYHKLRKFCMGIDHSWAKSATEYINLYHTLKN